MDRLENSGLWELLTEEERTFDKRLEACNTIEELQLVGEEINAFYKDKPIRTIDMTIEEFTKKYDLIDIKDLKGKYGF